MRNINFDTGWVLEVTDSIPWYAYLYLKFKIWRMKLNKRFTLDLSKGKFTKYLTSENINLFCSGYQFPLGIKKKYNLLTPFSEKKK